MKNIKVKYSFAEWCKDNGHEDWLSLWDYELNDVSPDEVAFRSTRKYWFKCFQGLHDSELKILSNLTSEKTHLFCKKCNIMYNNISVAYPDYVKYFANKLESENLTRWSEKSIDVVCPDCGYIFKKRVCDLISYPFNCKHCGDKSTYPNKFVFEFLLQLKELYNFDIYPEHVFEWSKNLEKDCKSRRIYDFYINDFNNQMIVEVHGEQHYNGSFQQYKGARTLQEELNNDAFKKDLAITNGIIKNNYIVIDARKSSPNWIKYAILNSGIQKVFPFQEDDIDWNKCNINACKNLVKIASELWNNGIRNTTVIGQKIGKTQATTISYLKRAHDLGWCDYTSKYIQHSKRKPVLCIDDNIAFESAQICSERSIEIFGVYMCAESIQNTACGTNSSYRGKHFQYINKTDLLKHYEIYPELTFMDEYFNNTNNTKLI